MNIPFSPPDITDVEIEKVTNVLKSGWITTGPVTKQFERDIANYCGVKRVACLNSATAAMELSLRILGVGAGDEVITSAYTYSASASVINHVGAKIVLTDTVKGGVLIDPEAVKEKITERTKAIISVDIGGIPANYSRLNEVIEEKRGLFLPKNEFQKKLGRVALIGDCAHSFGAFYNGRSVAQWADFSCFSFHAVKNLTTSEGGCVCFNDVAGFDTEEIYRKFMLLSLHGQDKDALEKTTRGSWEYDIVIPGYKCNMPDILAAFGSAQLERYDEMIAIRQNLVRLLNKKFCGTRVKPLVHEGEGYKSSFHAYIVRIDGFDEDKRNNLFEEMATLGVSLNVHFKPLPLMTAYKNLGFDIKDFPNAYDYYKAAITLPLFSKMSEEMAEYVANSLLQLISLPEYQNADS